MPGFTLSGYTPAPVEEVWKLLFDPTRFPEWWSGVETVHTEGPDRYVMWPDGYPDFPMPQELRSDLSGRSVTVSCLVSDLVFAYRLTPLTEGDGTEIAVHVELPEEEAHRLDSQRAVVRDSLAALAALAATA